MATRYRLPAALGGEEYEEYLHVDGSTEAPAGTVAFLLDGCIFTVARGLLFEVSPPLPEEPPVHAVVLVDGEALQRFDDEMRYPHVWAGVGSTQRYTWVQLCDLALPETPVRLVPDPFAEPVKLPWKSDPDVAAPLTSVEAAGERVYDHIVIGRTTGTPGQTAVLRPDVARAKARALWAAADAAEKEQS